MIPSFALLVQAASTLPSDASALERSISALESCISALDSKAKALANSSASLEPWSWLFTFLVAFGVAMEFWVIWHEHREDTETWALTFFGVHRTLRPHFERLIVEYISVALVAGGIIGELAVGIGIASINAQLRSVDTQLRSKNAELRITSDQLVALIRSEAEEAKRQAKESDLARVRLEASVEWRSLSEEQKKAFAQKLERYAGQRAEIKYNIGDSEAERFAVSIADVLSRAHWHVSPPQALMVAMLGAPITFVTGVSIQAGFDESDIPFVEPQRALLVKLLTDAGFDADGEFTWKTMPNPENRRVILIAVKHRPEGPQGEYKLQAEREAKAKNTKTNSTNR
jgi:hypothetical protein